MTKTGLSKVGFTLIYLTLLCSVTITMVSGQCQGSFQGLVQQCSRYVQRAGPKEPPSGECCAIVKNVDLPCVCGHITSEVEQIVSMEKAAYVASFCGKPIPRGTKCGSYVVPGRKLKIDDHLE